MTKTRIGERLWAAMNEPPKVEEKKSDEPLKRDFDGTADPTGGEEEEEEKNSQTLDQKLTELSKKYQTFTTQFKPLSVALKNHYEALQAMNKTESEMMHQIKKWAKDTPLQGGPDNGVAVQFHLLKVDKTYTENFMKDIMDYVHEWEIVVTTRIDAAIKEANELRKTYTHYKIKIQGLKQQEASVKSKGKNLDGKTADKLIRNEEKYNLARNEYIKYTTSVCNLIEAAVECSWKDLLPLLYKLANLSNDRVKDGVELIDSSEVIERLKTMAEEHNIDLTPPPSPPPETPKANNETKQQEGGAKVASEEEKHDEKPPSPSMDVSPNKNNAPMLKQ